MKYPQSLPDSSQAPPRSCQKCSQFPREGIYRRPTRSLRLVSTDAPRCTPPHKESIQIIQTPPRLLPCPDPRQGIYRGPTRPLNNAYQRLTTLRLVSNWAPRCSPPHKESFQNRPESNDIQWNSLKYPQSLPDSSQAPPRLLPEPPRLLPEPPRLLPDSSQVQIRARESIGDPPGLLTTLTNA